MTEIRSYRDLVAWQQAMDLAVTVYEVTQDWPRAELYGLTSQARRSATSVPANIAEGYGRDNLGSYLQFLRIAQGSLKELETHILIAERIGLTDNAEPLLNQTDTVGRILGGLIRKLAETT
ncbi:MAG: four helix bundle protein [Caulobacteraceae bacterium]